VSTKYQPLCRYLKAQSLSSIKLTFPEIEMIIGDSLAPRRIRLGGLTRQALEAATYSATLGVMLASKQPPTSDREP